MKQEITTFITENFKEQKDFFLKFYGTELPHFYYLYKKAKGCNPSLNFFKALFIFPINSIEHVEYNEYTSTQYFSSARPALFEMKKDVCFGFAPCEAVPIISTLDPFGVDGCGGDFFTSFSSLDEKIYHTWEDYEGFTIIQDTLSSMLERTSPQVRELYQLLLSEHQDKFNSFTHAPIEDQLDIVGIDLDEPTTDLALLIYSDYKKGDIELNYSYDYFEHYFNNPNSEYFHYDNAVAILNSKLAVAFYTLYFARKRKKLKKLLQATEKVKGQNLSTIRSYFERIIDTKWEKQEDIYIEKVDFE